MVRVQSTPLTHEIRQTDLSSKSVPQFGFSAQVWVPNVEHAFQLGKVVDIGAHTIKVEMVHDTDDPLISGLSTTANANHHRSKRPTNQIKPDILTFSYDDVYAAENEHTKDVDDNCALMFLNQATVLHNLRRRYFKDRVYTYVANILLAINPYKTIPSLYDLDTMRRYNHKSIGLLPPHVFAIGDKAYREMKHMKINQSIVVSGESGSGKTESVKYILKYLTNCYGHESGIIEERLVDSNPLLEAFGNAKTTRNNNSSRFGKFVELHFSKDYSIAGGYISHYLLERTRVCTQSSGERNYHIFYQLCCAADGNLRQTLGLSSPDKFEITKHGCTQYFLTANTESKVEVTMKSGDHKKHGSLKDIQLDDYESFQSCIKAMLHMNMTADVQLSVFSTVAALLHLGNVKFQSSEDDSSEGGCSVAENTKQSLKTASRLLQVNEDELCRAMTFRIMRPKLVHGRSGSVIFVPLKIQDAAHARDALCKTIYVRLFDYLVKTVNESIPPTDRSAYYIGMLDIAGFEYFPINSFEQFCINYCNERLQQFFNARILRDEQSIYEYEGLGVRHIEYVDNQDCIDLVEYRHTGILDLLDEESRLPQPSFTHFTSEVFAKNRKHERLDVARHSQLKLYREIRDDEGFLIRHFAGAVVYSTSEFIHKNNDAIHASLVTAVTTGTESSFLRNLFLEHVDQAMAEGKLNFISVGNKFKGQLTELLERLSNTGTSFVRCIKPNENMRPLEFDGPHILTQLQCAGMLSVLELMQQGYPSRAKFSVLYGLYQKYLPADLARLDPRFFCKGLFHCLNMDIGDYRFGLTMVFFRPGKFAEFDALMREDPEHLKQLIHKVRCWLCKARWRKAQYFIWSGIRISNLMKIRRKKIIRLQAAIRMLMEVKRNRFRINGLSKLQPLIASLKDIKKGMLVTEELKKSHEDLFAFGMNLQNTLRGHGNQEKVNVNWVSSVLNTFSINIDDLFNKSAATSAELAARKKAEDERLAQMQRKADMEQKRKEEEAKASRLLLEMEENKRRQIEERRQHEEELLRNRQELLAKASAEEAQLKREALLQRKKEEQMKIDFHLAQRLAASTGSDVDVMSIIGLPNATETAKENAAKYDLSSWKYAQLRDTINTSCDMDLLQACREEFHRRLRAYHVWKSRNKARGAPIDRRIPLEIVEAVKNMRTIVGSEAVLDNEQRYFRVLLSAKPLQNDNPPKSSPTTSTNRRSAILGESAWYAHFDGRWICRQMEVVDGKGVRPLIAGIDDIDMCELRLDETDLTFRKGVEILESEFEEVWKLNGGVQYMSENVSKISSKYLKNLASQAIELMDL